MDENVLSECVCVFALTFFTVIVQTSEHGLQAVLAIELNTSLSLYTLIFVTAYKPSSHTYVYIYTVIVPNQAKTSCLCNPKVKCRQ